jgi:dihydropyrimidine dehydrogenase (NAD+) subunit PreA
VKLTPNVSDIRMMGRAARRGGADGVSAINTLNSIMGIDLDTLIPRPQVDGRSAHGGYCGPAVKPIALHMAQQLTGDPEVGIPVSGIGGVSGWREAAEFLLLGCQNVQVCTAAMHFGYRIVEDMIDGLSNWMDEKGFRTLNDFRGKSLPRVADWKDLNLNYKLVARIDPDTCIGCQLCYTACWDGAHQCIHLDRVGGNGAGHRAPAQVEAESRKKISVTPRARLDTGPFPTPLERVPRVDEEECVGCNLCWLVCPVEGCITMAEIDTGLAPESWEERCQKQSAGTQ